MNKVDSAVSRDIKAVLKSVSWCVWLGTGTDKKLCSVWCSAEEAVNEATTNSKDHGGYWSITGVPYGVSSFSEGYTEAMAEVFIVEQELNSLIND